MSNRVRESALGSAVRTVREDAVEALVQNPLRPARLHETLAIEAKEEVSQRRRIKHARVVEDDEGHRGC